MFVYTECSEEDNYWWRLDTAADGNSDTAEDELRVINLDTSYEYLLSQTSNLSDVGFPSVPSTYRGAMDKWVYMPIILQGY